jgi:hypothetical protein
VVRPGRGLLSFDRHIRRYARLRARGEASGRRAALYQVVGGPREGARRWFVVKDLGASLGEMGRMDPRRGYIEGFEREPFITGVDKGWVRFGFRGRHQELLDRIGVEDVRWICQRLKRITNRQWHDAFRAGNYTSEVTARYVARIREKIDEGLRLP